MMTSCCILHVIYLPVLIYYRHMTQLATSKHITYQIKLYRYPSPIIIGMGNIPQQKHIACVKQMIVEETKRAIEQYLNV